MADFVSRNRRKSVALRLILGPAVTRITARLDSILSDLRYGARRLAAAPGFTLAAMLTLGLGIGANVAIVTLMYQVFLEPLPYADAERLVSIWGDASYRKVPKSEVSPPDYLDWRRQTTTLSGIAAFSPEMGTTAIGSDRRPEPIALRYVSGNFFTVLGVSPAAGRLLSDGDDRPGADVAVVGHRYWLQRFGGRRDLRGAVVESESRRYRVVGVLPEDFHYGSDNTDVWVPIRALLSDRDWTNRTNYLLEVVGRMRPGVSISQVHLEVDTLARGLAAAHLGADEPRGARVLPLREQFAGDVGAGYLTLLAGASCLLLVACLNVAHLLLLRGLTRRREIAVRAALGASRTRLMQQLVGECALLAAGGAVASLFVHQWTAGFLTRLVPTAMRGVTDLGIGGSVLAFTGLTGALAFCLAGLVPAIRVSRVRLADALQRQADRTVTASRLRSALVVCEVGGTVVLLVCSTLFASTLMRVYAVDLGFDGSNLLSITLPSRSADFIDRALERVRAVPGVVSAGVSTTVPLAAFAGRFAWRIDGLSFDDSAPPRALLRAASPGYLETLRVRLVAGRLLDESDRPGAPPAAVINEAMRRRYFGDRDAVGARLAREEGKTGSDVWYTVVGVIGDVKQRDLTAQVEPEVIVSHRQYAGPGAYRPRLIVARTAGTAAGLSENLRQAVGDLDAALALPEVVTTRERIGAAVDERRRRAMLFSAFGLVGLSLSMLGVYTLVSAMVKDRTQEIGVRLALGALPGAVVRMLVRQGLWLAAVGCAGGLAVAFAVTRSIQGFLWGVSATDPASFAAAAVLMLSVAGLACWIPARRTTRIDLRTALYFE
jgi:putative ABC transport system permease protein